MAKFLGNVVEAFIWFNLFVCGDETETLLLKNVKRFETFVVKYNF